MKKLFIISFLLLVGSKGFGQKFYEIPTQYLGLYQLMEIEDDHKDTVKAFKVSDFITYKEYKKYLTSIQKDSSEQFYMSQLPDTSISIDKKVYNEYITNVEYDGFPVLGISWENAMNYCKWKTLKDNKKGKIQFIYRLPKHSEWLSLLYYVRGNDISFEIDNKYSDWTLNTFDESAYNFGQDYLNSDYIYLHKSNDPPVLKRKRVVGKSYLYNIPSDGYGAFRYGYSTIGYRQIGFRVVKTKVDKYILDYWGIEE